MKLTATSRNTIINLLIDNRIESWQQEGGSEIEGLKVNIACYLHNGEQGYSKYTDAELLDELVFLKYGFDLEWEDN